MCSFCHKSLHLQCTAIQSVLILGVVSVSLGGSEENEACSLSAAPIIAETHWAGIKKCLVSLNLGISPTLVHHVVVKVNFFFPDKPHCLACQILSILELYTNLPLTHPIPPAFLYDESGAEQSPPS